mgnify:CR=1 FL=1
MSDVGTIITLRRGLALSPELTAEQSTAIAARIYGAGWKAAAGGEALVE